MKIVLTKRKNLPFKARGGGGEVGGGGGKFLSVTTIQKVD